MIRNQAQARASECRSATMVLAFPLNLFPEYSIRTSRPSRAAAVWDLATTYAIVTKHGGHISAHSKYGEGTEFVIVLPASPESPASESPVVAPLLKGTGRLLVMDDEEALRTLLDRSLTESGLRGTVRPGRS